MNWIIVSKPVCKTTIIHAHCVKKRTLCAEENNGGVQHTYLTACGKKYYFNPLTEQLIEEPEPIKCCRKCRDALGYKR